MLTHRRLPPPARPQHRHQAPLHRVPSQRSLPFHLRPLVLPSLLPVELAVSFNPQHPWVSRLGRTDFVPAATPSAQEGEPSSVFNPATFREFTPQNFELSTGVRDPVPRPAPTGRLIVTKINSNGAASEAGLSFDPFTMPTVAQTLPATPYNPYADDPTGLTGSSAFFQHPNAFNAPLQPVRNQ